MVLRYDKNTNKIETPTIILATKNFKKLGVIDNIIPTISCNDNSPDEISFRVYKEIDNKKCRLWDKINNLKLIWVKEINQYFEINISPTEEVEEYKDIVCTSLCEAELSQIMLYNVEINTDSDIERDEYNIPTVFYNDSQKDSSLLNRILEKAPHYNIGHIDNSLKHIQRSFSFDDTSIYDALNEISEEIGCIFKFDTRTRTINAYDLYLYCNDCGKRFDTFENVCPECHGANVNLSYGKRTPIFFSTKNIAESLSIDYAIDEYKNCFRLKSGDDLFDATIRSINPNGTNYIYNISELMVEDMSQELLTKLKEYNSIYDNVINEYIPPFSLDLKTKYNELVEKYNSETYASYQYDDNGERVLKNNDYMNTDSITNYEGFIKFYYDAVDFNTYLTSKLMPVFEIEETNASLEMNKLTSETLSPVCMSSLNKSTSKNTIENQIKNCVQLYTNGAYKISIETETYTYEGLQSDGYNLGTWNGLITITKFGNGEDTAFKNITIQINDNYPQFLEQKLKKALFENDDNIDNGSIYDIINIKYTEDDTQFKDAIKFYNLNRLISFRDSYQSALNVLIEANQSNQSANLYESLYVPYRKRMSSLEDEINIRSESINIVDNVLDEIEEIQSQTKNTLDIEEFLGKDLWLEFCSYRREDTYENENYISDGLDNSQLVKNARQFFELAQKELVKSGKVGITISGKLINFMSIKEFLPIMDYFDTGIWVKVEVDDKIYNVRLTSYNIDFDNLEYCDITFSDVMQEYKSPTEKTLENMKNMSTSYSFIKKQVENSKESVETIRQWRENGLDLTNQNIVSSARNQDIVYDKNGILLRSKDDATEQYSPEQIRILNSTIAFTDDNWESSKVALGKIIYIDPETNEAKYAYGLNSEVLIGSLILGEKLGIYSGDKTLKFDNNGLVLNTISDENGVYNPIFSIQKDGNNQMYIDQDGNLVLGYGTKIIWDEIDTKDLKAPSFKISASSQIFKVDKNGNITEPNKIIINIVKQNIDSSVIWTNDKGIKELQGDIGSDIEVLPSYFNNIDSLTITAQAGEYTDSITIIKLKDGEEGSSGQDSCSVLLSNDNYTFAGDEESAIEENIEVKIIGYKGLTQIPTTIGNITGIPTGMTVNINNNGTINTSIIIKSTKNLKTRNGMLYIPITLNNITITKYFGYTIAIKGQQGIKGEQGIPGTNGSNGKTSYLHIKYSNDGGSTFTSNSGETVGTYIGTCVDYNSTDPTTVGSYTWAKIKGDNGESSYNVILSNEFQGIAGDTSKALPTNITINVDGFYGSAKQKTTIGNLVGLPTGMTATINNNNTSNTTITFNITNALTTKSGRISIPVTIGGITFTKYFSFTLNLKGANGSNGKSLSIVASSQLFKSMDNGKTFSPATITLTPVMQGVTFSKWQYSTNGGTSWVNVVSGQNGLSISGNVLSVSVTSSLFSKNITTLSFKCISSDSSIYDITTITRLYDVAEMTQKDVFNKLTNNGAVQGLQMDEKGDLYFNASYINTGKLSADFIDAKGLVVTNASGINTLLIDSNGDIIMNNLTANNGVFNGQINANDGTIGGWKIDEYNIYAENVYEMDNGENKFIAMLNAGGSIIFTTQEKSVKNPLEWFTVAEMQLDCSKGLWAGYFENSEAENIGIPVMEFYLSPDGLNFIHKGIDSSSYSSDGFRLMNNLNYMNGYFDNDDITFKFDTDLGLIIQTSIGGRVLINPQDSEQYIGCMYIDTPNYVRIGGGGDVTANKLYLYEDKANFNGTDFRISNTRLPYKTTSVTVKIGAHSANAINSKTVTVSNAVEIAGWNANGTGSSGIVLNRVSCSGSSLYLEFRCIIATDSTTEVVVYYRNY